ncbi:dTMP kinase [Swingsia samuiensis]|uniref:Thymidylate kinase n=1 Tax=Swingsia samuiensis TaxID=1293412 RepID=A0A4Y6UF25_9PROT|nr:dTMP kinase [Swingsia samuiensis]QDH16149.1 dTMP kinase [Swingsia samuiensis]
MALHNKSSGLFITLEGGEGVGKSTQARLLATALSDLGHEVVLTREPGGTPGAEAIRNLLLFGKDELSWRAEIMGHMAARCDHLDGLIKPALKRGALVICDRFHDSTLAYQGYGVGKGEAKRLEFIKKARHLVDFEPHLTLLLDVPRKDALARLKERGGATDRYEGQEEAFHQRVSEGFDAIAKSDPERVHRFDALQEAGALKNELLNKIIGCVEKNSLDKT